MSPHVIMLVEGEGFEPLVKCKCAAPSFAKRIAHG